MREGGLRVDPVLTPIKRSGDWALILESYWRHLIDPDLYLIDQDLYCTYTTQGLKKQGKYPGGRGVRIHNLAWEGG